MIATRVTGDGAAVGGTLEAFSGLGPIGFLDTMQITLWDPPRRCDVVHTGRLVRGSGSFLVDPTDAGSTLTWIEELDIPGGRIGGAAFAVAKPITLLLIQQSLQRFARWVESVRSPRLGS
jgi:hypothetical protein